jgi:hypothetical protein
MNAAFPPQIGTEAARLAKPERAQTGSGIRNTENGREHGSFAFSTAQNSLFDRVFDSMFNRIENLPRRFETQAFLLSTIYCTLFFVASCSWARAPSSMLDIE